MPALTFAPLGADAAMPALTVWPSELPPRLTEAPPASSVRVPPACVPDDGDEPLPAPPPPVPPPALPPPVLPLPLLLPAPEPPVPVPEPAGAVADGTSLPLAGGEAASAGVG
jgi:hypothetical protein